VGVADIAVADGVDAGERALVAGVYEFIDEHELDLVHFTEGRRKDDVT